MGRIGKGREGAKRPGGGEGRGQMIIKVWVGGRWDRRGRG